MKALTIQQPWASLVAHGIKDVENRTWSTPYRGKLLIHAASKKAAANLLDTLPIEWSAEIVNQVNMGALPAPAALPTGAIVGYVELAGIVGPGQDTESMWSEGPDAHKWVLRDAHVFDQPITGVRGQEGLWEFDLDEDSLPASRAVPIADARVTGTQVEFDVSREVFGDFAADEFFSFYLTERLLRTMFEHDAANNVHNLKPFDSIVFVLPGGERHEYKLPTGIQVLLEQDEDGNPITVPGIYGDDEPIEYIAGVIEK